MLVKIILKTGKVIKTQIKNIPSFREVLNDGKYSISVFDLEEEARVIIPKDNIDYIIDLVEKEAGEKDNSLDNIEDLVTNKIKDSLMVVRRTSEFQLKSEAKLIKEYVDKETGNIRGALNGIEERLNGFSERAKLMGVVYSIVMILISIGMYFSFKAKLF